MSRPKQEVPIPAHITPEAIANRVADGWKSQHRALLVELDEELATLALRPTLVASNDAPIDKGLIGHPKPKLVVSNDLLPEVDWQ